MRKWLNETFFNAAFSTKEQKKILNTKVTADANLEYSTNPGNDTTDKVFLLSINETEKYFGSNDDRMCVPTAYAIENGVWTNRKNNICWWWLRTPGDRSDRAAAVGSYGNDEYDGVYVSSGTGSVRPAMWIEIA